MNNARGAKLVFSRIGIGPFCEFDPEGHKANIKTMDIIIGSFNFEFDADLD